MFNILDSKNTQVRFKNVKEMCQGKTAVISQSTYFTNSSVEKSLQICDAIWKTVFMFHLHGAKAVSRTRMHYSRMGTDRVLTVFPVCILGWGGVWGGGCLHDQLLKTDPLSSQVRHLPVDRQTPVKTLPSSILQSCIKCHV